MVLFSRMLLARYSCAGLDSVAALSVMDAVARVAESICVICTIHQPSAAIFNRFNTLLLLKAPGQVVYFVSVAYAGHDMQSTFCCLKYTIVQ